MPKNQNTICLYGAGVMGRAIGLALVKRGLAAKNQLWGVSKTEETAKLAASELGVKIVTKNFSADLKKSSVVVLAVKPSQARAALRELKENGLGKKTLVISIVTGVPLAVLQAGLGSGVPVIRAVTNTPCVVGQGMTALCAGDHVSSEQSKLAHSIFESVGMCVEVEEQHCEAVTGLSACGPAYMYLILEALADGGVRVGLPRETALKLVAQTALGAARMVQESGRHPASLRDDVTTPAGCTIGALLVMEDGKLRSTLARAVEEATRIAKNLGKE